ncbi:MAG: dTDP-glucose 4,6-dehydratase, partial [Syntrophobacterales bacterium]|nr:dTDP-glucose 4,6-dehydratase [Syntrophobacterales bacterium]
MKTYLITGGAGFIGSNYILQLLESAEPMKIINLDALTYAGNLENLQSIEKDPRYLFIHGNICDETLLNDIFTKNQIDYVVNFAAESHVDRSIAEPRIFLDTNVGGTFQLLNAAKQAWEEADGKFRAGVKFLQISTDEVYGSLGETGLFTETTPLDPHSPYSAAKTSADLFVKAYVDTYGFPANITRCSNKYGPWQFPEKLIPLVINNAINGRSIPVYGDGGNIRDWLYVADHCRAIQMVLTQAKPGETYNIGGNNERKNIEIVNLILDAVRRRGYEKSTADLITYVTDRKGHDRRYGIDPAKIKNDLDWEPQVSFGEGIKNTVDWYLGHMDWMKKVTDGSYMTYYQQMYG